MFLNKNTEAEGTNAKVDQKIIESIQTFYSDLDSKYLKAKEEVKKSEGWAKEQRVGFSIRIVDIQGDLRELTKKIRHS
jgi:ACT domain-containing protein